MSRFFIKMGASHPRRAAVMLFLGILLGLPAHGRPWLFEPDRSPECRQFREKIHRLDSSGAYQLAKEELLADAQAHAGTSRGGSSLLDAANLTFMRLEDPEGAKALFQQAIVQYPGSLIEVGARSNLANWEWQESGDNAAYLTALDAISRDLGGPSIAEILGSADTRTLLARVKGLHPEVQLGIWNVLKRVEARLIDPDERLTIARFGRALDGVALPGTSNFDLTLTGIIIDRFNPPGALGSIASTPTVTVVAPAPGSTVAPEPELQLRITTGNYHYANVDLARLRFSVDGVDRSFEVIVKSDVDLSFAEGVNFETLSLSLPTVLGTGQHSATVRVFRSKIASDPPEGPEPVEITWSFTVSDNPPPPPPPPGPTTETRGVLKDALVFEKSQHANEGANPRLPLEKINGKAARNLLGFDLAGVNTNSLSSATLVLSIDPSDQVTGWGNGETVSIKPVTVAWQEGNGKKHGLPSSQQTTGSGAGTTWFSPTDENISNDSANGVVQWSGAAAYATTGTAPALTVHNHQTGELRFDVTQDVLNGVTHGWLLRKDAENKGSKVSFYSREGGGADLGPRLILEYGSTAMGEPNKMHTAVAAFFGFKSRSLTLQASAGVSEGPRGLKEFLRRSPGSAFVGEQVVLGIAGHYPLAQLGSRVVYRSWLREAPSLV